MLPAWQGSSTEGRPRFTHSDALSAGRHLPRTPAAPCGGGVGGQAGSRDGRLLWESLVVQGLGLQAFIAKGPGLIPGQGN